jgi:hypothetical protein
VAIRSSFSLGEGGVVWDTFSFCLITRLFLNEIKKFLGIVFFLVAPLSVIFFNFFVSKIGPLRFFKISQNLGAEPTAKGKVGQRTGFEGDRAQILNNNLFEIYIIKGFY